VNKRYYNNDSTVISRLADQAHETSCLIYDERLKKERADAVIFYDIFNQKFAELIVRECAQVSEDDITDGDACCTNTAYRIAKQIKKHFGVE
jgi:hypothetical protein